MTYRLSQKCPPMCSTLKISGNQAISTRYALTPQQKCSPRCKDPPPPTTTYDENATVGKRGALYDDALRSLIHLLAILKGTRSRFFCTTAKRSIEFLYDLIGSRLARNASQPRLKLPVAIFGGSHLSSEDASKGPFPENPSLTISERKGRFKQAFSLHFMSIFTKLCSLKNMCLGHQICKSTINRILY